MKISRHLSLLALGLMPWSAVATAAVTQYEVTGTVASVVDGLNLFGGSIAIGQAFTATLNIDHQTPVLTAPPLVTWEQGGAKPRVSQLAALAPIRGMGKRVALAKREEMGAQA